MKKIHLVLAAVCVTPSISSGQRERGSVPMWKHVLSNPSATSTRSSSTHGKSQKRDQGGNVWREAFATQPNKHSRPMGSLVRDTVNKGGRN